MLPSGFMLWCSCAFEEKRSLARCSENECCVKDNVGPTAMALAASMASMAVRGGCGGGCREVVEVKWRLLEAAMSESLLDQ